MKVLFYLFMHRDACLRTGALSEAESIVGASPQLSHRGLAIREAIREGGGQPDEGAAQQGSGPAAAGLSAQSDEDTSPRRDPTAEERAARPWAGTPGRTSAARAGPARHCAAAPGCGRLPRSGAGASPSIWAATFGGRRSPARSWCFSGSGSSAGTPQAVGSSGRGLLRPWAPQGRGSSRPWLLKAVAPQAVRPRQVSAGLYTRGGAVKTARPVRRAAQQSAHTHGCPLVPLDREVHAGVAHGTCLGGHALAAQRPAPTEDGADSAKSARSDISVGILARDGHAGRTLTPAY